MVKRAVYAGSSGKPDTEMAFVHGALSGIFASMNSVLKWVLGLFGPLLLMASPYLCRANLNFLWLIVPLFCAWAFWLMMLYLRWAKTLGKK